MARRSKSGGFTLVELLVVISIIGMLMSLLVVAVQAARESGRRTTCVNNQHQLVTALDSFESAKRYFPGTTSRVYKGPVTAATPLATIPIVSYVVPLLPYMERNDLWDQWSSTAIVSVKSIKPPAPYMASLICPSHLRPSTNLPYLAYVINGGIEPVVPNNPYAPPPPAPQVWTPAQRMASGIAFDQTGTDSIRVGKDYIDANDGTSTTLLLTEGLQAGYWMPPPPIYPATTPIAGTVPASTARAWTAFTWTVSGSGTLPKSNHRGGFNTQFADAHYKFLGEEMDYLVYRQLMSPANDLLPGPPPPIGTIRVMLLNSSSY